MTNTFIKEIFSSIQGEGPYIGFEQLFIRFSKCNLKCSYCDTNFISDLKEFTPEQLACDVAKYETIHSVSLTGGEPLLDFDFLKEFLPLVDKKIYLETNGTLFNELEQIIDLVNIISMDIKLNSTSNNGDLFEKHRKFIDIAVKNNKEIFVKIVFDEKITDDEISKCIELVKDNNILIILQPKMDGENLNLSNDIINKVFAKFVEQYKDVRLIPQVHKFLKVQ